jgi:hypothetical protein
MNLMKKYDYFIKDLSKDPKDPAFTAYVPNADAHVYGESFAELQQGIELALEHKKSNEKKFKITRTSLGRVVARPGRK